MLLAIDVGNTHTVLGVHDGHGWHAWRIHTNPARTEDEHYALLQTLLHAKGLHAPIRVVVIATVVPALEDTLRMLAERWLRCEPLVVSYQLDLGIQVAYEPPSAVGADRLANAVGAKARYGLPAVVVDFGTATTLDAITREGVYLGGAILPGVELMLESLAGRTARLPRIALWNPSNTPDAPVAIPPIGRSTPESLRSGVLLGSVGAIERLITLFKAELGSDTRVIATGGLAERVMPLCPQIEQMDPLLTLEGLRIIYERNRRPIS
jgi:type III pantothenate kinase